MSRTKAQMVVYCGEVMGIIGEGESLSTAADTDLGLAYGQLFALLDRKNMVDFSSVAVPDEYVYDFACMMGMMRASSYDVPDNNYQRMALRVGADLKKGEANIRELQATSWSGQTVPGEYM